MGSSSSSSSSSYCKYGNIMKVETSGASSETAKQDSLGYSGVRASHTMAKTDIDRMENYRESRAGNTLDNGCGDWNPRRNAYNAFGLMQVDTNPSGGGHIAEGAWDSEVHLCQGTRILVGFIERIRNKFPDWCTEQKLKGGIAAYNMGDGNVHSYSKVDENTTGRDYSNDVVARAQWYKNNGFGS
ncbi:G-type lysozyme isoform 6 [Scophthalmus maximus]|uniref:Lysozyme g n=1 Tax=Scophthalmus maximus TaxID=52904 RepID=A0A2U9BQN5_SCOMX|nr:lysozyme g isoform X2 [Scophthalmus maximus]AWP05859.1 G-type lysozyme isoform 6 [Scophthalmus maximus]